MSSLSTSTSTPVTTVSVSVADTVVDAAAVPAVPHANNNKRQLAEEEESTQPRKCRVESTTPGRYVCSLLVMEVFDSCDTNLITHKTYVTNTEADAVRNAIGEFVSRWMITYKKYEDSYKKCGSALEKYQKECEEKKVDSDSKRWSKLISKKTIPLSASVSHLLLLDENGKVDVKKCDQDMFFQRLYSVNTVESFQTLIKDIAPESYTGSDLTVVQFQCLDTQKDENKDILPQSISEKTKDVDSFKAKVIAETVSVRSGSDSDDSDDNE
jgi:hypothetical protein